MKFECYDHGPISLHIADQVAGDVYRLGELLPVWRTLALSRGVNPNTVQKVLNLERREFVVPRRGLAVSANSASPVEAVLR